MKDVQFPDAKHVVVVMDNLNTNRPSSVYKTFPPAEAKRILDCQRARTAFLLFLSSIVAEGRQTKAIPVGLFI